MAGGANTLGEDGLVDDDDLLSETRLVNPLSLTLLDERMDCLQGEGRSSLNGFHFEVRNLLPVGCLIHPAMSQIVSEYGIMAGK
jgi:hypothetical protein